MNIKNIWPPSYNQQLLSGNKHIKPTVGEGATQIRGFARDCFEVVSVSDDERTVVLEELTAVPDVDNMFDPEEEGHQCWILKPSGKFVTVTFMDNGWFKVEKEISVFTGQEIDSFTKIDIFFGKKDYWHHWRF